MLLFRQQKPFKLSSLIKILSTHTQKQPQKYQRINFSLNGLDISSTDDSLLIFIGIRIRKQLFDNYICEKNTKLLVPLHKLQRILALPSQIDDSLMLTYQNGSDQLKFRIYSTKTNQKMNITLQIPKQFGEMISQKYQQPLNPIQYINQLILTNNSNQITKFSQFAVFTMANIQFIRICKQFALVCDKISIRFQSQLQSNKKYIIFSAPTINGIKTISLSQQKTMQQLQMSINFQARSEEQNNRLPISGVFNIALLEKIMNVNSFANQIFQDNVKIFLERGKTLSILYQFKNGEGELCCLVSSL